MSSWVVCFLTVGFLLQLALRALNEYGNGSIIGAGLGSVTPETLITWQLPTRGTAAILSSTIISNLPQLVLSGLYMLLNNLLTRLLIAEEWSGFCRHRKGLRLSRKATGEQRSTYFLTIPLRYGIPSLVTSSLIHWLASQSIFFAKIDRYSPQGVTNPPLTTCGFSPLAIILTLAAGGVVVAATIAVSVKPTNVDMPHVGSCSRAIASACFPPEDGADTTAAVRWGVIPMQMRKIVEVKWERVSVGHCSFSSGEVKQPIEGELYM